MSESYDEILFTSPTRQFYEHLMSYGQQLMQKAKPSAITTATSAATDSNNPAEPVSMSSNVFERKATACPEYYLPYDDQMDVETLLRIRDHLQHEILGK